MKTRNALPSPAQLPPGGEGNVLQRFAHYPRTKPPGYGVPASAGGTLKTHLGGKMRKSLRNRERGQLKPGLHTPEANCANRNGRSTAGFTLTEIMVVLIVIGIIAAAIVPQFIGTTQDAKVSSAKGSVTELESAVDRFYYNMDRYPTTEEGLKALVEAPTGEETKWRGPYIKMLRNDPWGNPYQYRSPGTHHTSGFDLWSRGADGVDGGEGQNADIGNWQ
jgi:general secretion pathway protein G